MKKFLKGLTCGILFFIGAGVVYAVLDGNDFFRNHSGKKKKDFLEVEDLDDEYEEDWLDDDWLDDEDDSVNDEPDKEENATE